ncbi:MAG: hypothetical protein EPO11_07225 [Gammaproteobacteria bacterium]|nr:MAG: hypothetical protein EPO11_07225 [Gammaproteobacteria bacterium]
MRRFTPGLLAASGLTALLCACAPFHPSDDRAGVCNQLNSQIIFSGSTSSTRDAEIQSAEKPLLQRSYDRHCVKNISDES